MEIDLQEIGSIDELHQVFKDRLAFPDFYGRNWDAFWDTITGLVELPEQLTLLHWSSFVRKFPKDGKILLRLVRDYNSISHQQIVLVH